MEAQTKSLGQELKEARQLNDFSLRDVEDLIQVSNAYLSQLENDKVKNPSANILYKLANLYRLSFELLLKKAGVIQASDHTNESLSGSAFRSQNVTPEEEQALADYLSFLRYKNKKH